MECLLCLLIPPVIRSDPTACSGEDLYRFPWICTDFENVFESDQGGGSEEANIIIDLNYINNNHIHKVAAHSPCPTILFDIYTATCPIHSV